MGPIAGPNLQRISAGATAVFALTTALAVLSEGFLRSLASIVSLLLFAVGCVAFLGAFALGVGRSRTEELDVAGLFLLIGSAPRSVQLRMHGLTALQLAVALVGAAFRPFTALAFGILVPMFGFGITGLWGGWHGVFRPKGTPDHDRPEYARPAEGETDG